MKKILIAVLLTAGTFGFANAQAKQKVMKPVAATHTTVTAKTKTTAPVKATVTAAPVKVTTTTTTPKKTATKTAVSSKTVVAVSSGSHLKSDGTADKRYKENKMTVQHVKKDGTPDMRYKTNKK
ncbi:MAG: hypothetical protein ABIR31_11445 [Ginsengibacter sp.]